MASRAALKNETYPGAVAIRRAFKAARDNGLDPAGFEVSPDGTIRIMDARLAPKPPADEFERLDAAGML